MVGLKCCRVSVFQLETVTEGGKLFAKVGGSLQEVVFATAGDLAKLPYPGEAKSLKY